MSTQASRLDPQVAWKEIVARAACCTFNEIPPDVRERAKHCLLDWLGVVIAAADDPLIRLLVSEFGGTKGACTLIGRPERAQLTNALLINGTAGHLLDYDDVHSAIPGHVTVALAPVILAIGENAGKRGSQAIASFVAGFEAMCSLARLTGNVHYQTGFHATATVGTFGAALSACHMIGASEQQMLAAVANASTQAAGLRSAFGTPYKSIQVGRASVNGHFAAATAMRGIDAGPSAFAGREGFLDTHHAAIVGDVAAPRGYFLRDVIFKFHASCFLTHAPIEALLRLKSEVDLPYDKVERIELRVHTTAHTCDNRNPRTALESKFSFQQTAAMVLSGLDTADITAFDRSTHLQPVARWREKIALSFDPTVPATRCIVRAELSDGTVAEGEHDSERTDDDLQRQEKRLSNKFMALAIPALGASAASQVRDFVLNLEELDNFGVLCRGIAGRRPVETTLLVK